MGYLIAVYILIGTILLFFIVPKYLKNKGVDSFQPIKPPKKEILWHFLDPYFYGYLLFVLFYVAAVSATWPITAPLWTWSELSAKKEKEKFLREQKEEEERSKTDKYHGLSMEQKIEKLRELSES